MDLNMEKRRLEKNYKPQPISFVDLAKKYAKNFPKEKLYVVKEITVPLYVVNKVSGMMTEINYATLTPKKYCTYNDTFCKIAVYRKKDLIASFSIKEEDKNKSYLIDIKWGSFFSGNYELFLRQEEAAGYSKEILLKKKEKLDKEIELLEFLSI